MIKKIIPNVSVIIPMYNAENYIGECLQSLLNQTLKNIELIVVDDCSKDNSVSTVENFSSDFISGEEVGLNLIKLEKNSGCAAVPRNIALKFAQGKYIYFLDSDDFIDKTALEDFYKVAEEFQADVVHSEKYFEYIETAEGFQNIITGFQTGNFVTEPTLETSDFGKRVNDFIQKKYLWWGCNKLFRRTFLADNKIQFPTMKTFEDLVFSFCCLISAKNYVRVPFVNYHYRIRKNSLSHKGNSFSEIMQCLMEGVKTIENFACGKKFFVDNPDYRYLFAEFFTQEIMNISSREILLGDKYSMGEIYDFLIKEVFANNTGGNEALMSYLFIATNIYKLLSEQQANQIKQLQNQLIKFQN